MIDAIGLEIRIVKDDVAALLMNEDAAADIVGIEENQFFPIIAFVLRNLKRYRAVRGNFPERDPFRPQIYLVFRI